MLNKGICTSIKTPFLQSNTIIIKVYCSTPVGDEGERSVDYTRLAYSEKDIKRKDEVREHVKKHTKLSISLIRTLSRHSLYFLDSVWRGYWWPGWCFWHNAQVNNMKNLPLTKRRREMFNLNL